MHRPFNVISTFLSVLRNVYCHITNYKLYIRSLCINMVYLTMSTVLYASIYSVYIETDVHECVYIWSTASAYEDNYNGWKPYSRILVFPWGVVEIITYCDGAFDEWSAAETTLRSLITASGGPIAVDPASDGEAGGTNNSPTAPLTCPRNLLGELAVRFSSKTESNESN